MPLPQRKSIRLPGYDYSLNGAYFITICTHNKKDLFGQTEENTLAHRVIDYAFHETLARFPTVCCPKYVIMPNHFYAIIIIEDENNNKDLRQFIQAFKSKSTVIYGQYVKRGYLPPFEQKIWQRSFYDHIIRNDWDYREIWQYIDNNPLKWDLNRNCPHD